MPSRVRPSHSDAEGAVVTADLVAWLRTQLDEDERLAAAAAPNAWTVDQFTNQMGGEFLVIADYAQGAPAFALRDKSTAEHIATHDPARVLAEVQSKRAILARYEDCERRTEDAEYSRIEALEQIREYEDFVLPALALPYVDRPGFQEEWRA